MCCCSTPRAGAPSVLQLALRLLQLAACLFVGFHKQPVYTSSCISLLSTPLSFFAVYDLDRSRSPTMFNILLVIYTPCTLNCILRMRVRVPSRPLPVSRLFHAGCTSSSSLLSNIRTTSCPSRSCVFRWSRNCAKKARGEL